jgi:hypothetical protein
MIALPLNKAAAASICVCAVFNMMEKPSKACQGDEVGELKRALTLP